MRTEHRAPRAWHIAERFGRHYVENQYGGFEGWHTTRAGAIAAGRAYVATYGDTFDEGKPTDCPNGSRADCSPACDRIHAGEPGHVGMILATVTP